MKWEYELHFLHTHTRIFYPFLQISPAWNRTRPLYCFRFLHKPLNRRRNHAVTPHAMFIHGRWQPSVSEKHITSTYRTADGGKRLPWIFCLCVCLQCQVSENRWEQTELSLKPENSLRWIQSVQQLLCGRWEDAWFEIIANWYKGK